MTTAGYALDNSAATASPMLECLSAILDPVTQAHLRQLDLTPLGRYWEMAAGNGSVAAWLVRALGPTAEVVATDVNTRHIPIVGGLQVVRHDDSAMPPLAGPWNGVHARLAFAHWLNPVEVVRGLVSVLRPGGWLLVEDWGPWTGMVLDSPYPDAAGIYGRYQEGLRGVFRSRGNDASWATSALGVFSRAGLVGVRTTVTAETWAGGSPGARLPVVVSTELRQQLIEHGVTAADLDALPAILNDPATTVLGNATWSTVGIAPTA